MIVAPSHEWRRAARDLAHVCAGAKMAWANGWWFSGTFLSELANTTHSYGTIASLRYAFNLG